ncbi:ribosome small subunit-dependent GTPase A [uncultured Algibacter sp.]|uniref:ribosome small subunit-dependent GTPase A n=1 Tax=uncultured Algibacter sp. TaxID=298659 RepID=UPI002630FD15|nr:ribosome small subunit-dependent GTPase A [uncultured Algibacter sp.]
MKLEHFGYNDKIEKLRIQYNLINFEVGRIISEHKERYIVKTEKGEFDAEITGNLRYTANTREDFPAVGDWVAISEYDDNKVLIHSIFPRKTIIERQAVGKQGEKQIIATNIDFAFIVQAVDRDFNINRIERYLTICNTSNVKPIIILNKIDLINDTVLNDLMSKVQERVKQVPVIAISNESQKGIERVKKHIVKGKTYCLLGSSGVGKSSLLNNLSGKQLMKTNTISTSTNKGRHVTSHRELIVLENGGIIIDNPGIREVGIADSIGGLEKTFEKIIELSKNCKFKDCTHTIEIGCAVISAVETEKVDKLFYENYLKMNREKEHFESTVAEKRKKDKNFGKMVKQFKNLKKSNKY